MAEDVNQLFSNAKSVASKLSAQDIGGKINAGIKNVSSALNQAGLSVKSEFTRTDLPFVNNRRVQGGKKPEVTRVEYKKTSSFLGSLVYPGDMKYYTLFKFKKYQKIDVVATAKELPTISIVLPIPSNLNEAFNVEYDTPALGPVVGAAVEGIGNILRTVQDEGVGQAVDNISAAKLASAGKDAVLAGVLKGVSAVNETAGNIAAATVGIAPNPHLATIFRNIGMRTHSFSYRFAPNSETELRNIKNIIKELKQRMLPGLSKDNNILFTFPDLCDISFGPSKEKPYTIKTCVLESLNVNYAPSGTPAFFKTGDPVEVEINMTFKETKVFTREDVV